MPPKNEKKQEKVIVDNTYTDSSSSNESNKNILDVLANLSATDSWHDFHDSISDFKDIITKNKEIYCEGLPPGVTELGKFNKEEFALSSVIKTKDGRPIQNFGEELTNANTREYKANQEQYIINTINNTEFSVKPLVVASGSKKNEEGKTYLTAGEFTDILEIDDGSAIVIDAAAVSVLTILKNGPPVMEGGVRKKLFYIITPEVVNDPAGKISVSEKNLFEPEEKGKESGMLLIGCEPNSPESINYNYSYDKHINTGELLKNKTTNPYDKFFSAYNFQLSEVQRIRKGKKTEYTTNLLIKSNDPRINVPENVQDSKKKNAINFLTSLLLGAIKMLGGKSDTLKNKFLFNTKLQQKRSGDWLQVLACLLLKSRKLKQYNPPGSPPRMQSIEEQITKVFFVTHDRVALAFALLLGVECIYTHAATKSCYIFKLSSQSDVAAANERFLENKKNELTSLKTKLEEAMKYFSEIQMSQYAIYNSFRDQNIVTYSNQIINTSNKFPDLFAEGKMFNTSDFTKLTSETFELCLLYDYLLLNFPDLSNEFGKGENNLYKDMYELTEKIQKLVIEIRPGLPKEEIDNLKININDLINVYNSIIGKISTFETTLNKYTTNDKQPIKLKINIETTINNFQKTPNRKLASGWTWDNTQGNSRIWETIKSAIGDTSYKSDKNIFLYTINLIPNNLKKFLCKKYFEIKKRIENPSTILSEIVRKTETVITTEQRKNKFLSVANGFISEVFLNFGFVSQDDNLVQELSITEETHLENAEYENIIETEINKSNPENILNEASIISENNEATYINEEAQNPPENFIRDNTILNYSTEVNVNPEIVDGRPIVDSEEISKTVDELNKIKQEASENIDSAKQELLENENQTEVNKHTNPRDILEDDEEFKKMIDSAIQNVVIEEGITHETPNIQDNTYKNYENHSEEEDVKINPESIKEDIIKDTVDNIKQSYETLRSIDSELIQAAPTPHEITKEDLIEVRKPFSSKENVNLDGIPIRNGAKLLGADFETNIKSATYVLLNALLDYKGTIDGLQKIYDILKNEKEKEEKEEKILSTDEIDESVKLPSPPIPVSRAKTQGRSVLETLPPVPIAQPIKRNYTRGIDSLHFVNGPQLSKRMRGGSSFNISKEEYLNSLSLFFEDLNLNTNDNIVETNENDLLKDINYLFHPLLPIYMIAESLHEISSNDSIEDSLDYELYQKYLKLLESMRSNILYDCDSGNSINIIAAFMKGVCLREFFFYSNVFSMTIEDSNQTGGRAYQIQPPLINIQKNLGEGIGEKDNGIDLGEGKKQLFNQESETSNIINEYGSDNDIEISDDSYCRKVFGISKSDFLPISILTGVFSYFISGIKIRTEEEISRGKVLLKSKLFTDFIKKINISDIFGENIDPLLPIKDFKNNCYTFLIETGNLIISDRTRTPIEEIQYDSSYNYPNIITRRELDANAAEGRMKRGFGGSKKLIKKHKRTIKLTSKNKKRYSKIRKIKNKRYTKRK
jgi:hypothetical protein